MLPTVRRRIILDLLAAQEFVTMHEIRTITAASLSTVRRDIQRLELAGSAVQIRGGVTRPAAGAAMQLRSTLAKVRVCLDAPRDLALIETVLGQALAACKLYRRSAAWAVGRSVNIEDGELYR
jgi:hypothetical protein